MELRALAPCIPGTKVTFEGSFAWLEGTGGAGPWQPGYKSGKLLSLRDLHPSKELRRTRPMKRVLPLSLVVLLAACSVLSRSEPPSIPEDEARHRAALTPLTVFNRTEQRLTIAFRGATPPAREVVLGAIPATTRDRVAPIPAGEPIILFARRDDGSELALAPRSYPTDTEWTWEIPATAVFRQP